MRTRVLHAPAALAAALAAGCASDPELEGAAAARSRGADVAGTPGDAAKPPAPSKPVDPWLDDLGVLARVNGKVITLGQVRHMSGPSYEQYLDQRDRLAVFVRAKVKELVVRQVVVEEIRRLGVRVTDEDLERDELEREKEAAKAGTTVEQHLRDIGMTRREWDENRRDDIYYALAQYYFGGIARAREYSEDRFRPSVDVYVSPEEVRAYGEARRAEIESPETATIRVLDLRWDSFREGGGGDDEARRRCERALDAVEERLRAGEAFEDVARQVSQGPEAAKGGLMGPFEREGPLLAEYRDWAFAEGRREGDVSGRIRLPSGIVLLRLERREASRSPSIEEWGPRVRARLEGLKRTLAWDEVQARLLEQASITPADFRDGLLEEIRAVIRGLRRELPSLAGGRTVGASSR